MGDKSGDHSRGALHAMQAAMVILTGIVLAAVAIALGHGFARVRVVRPTRRGLIERFGEYGASRSWISSVQ